MRSRSASRNSLSSSPERGANMRGSGSMGNCPSSHPRTRGSIPASLRSARGRSRSGGKPARFEEEKVDENPSAPSGRGHMSAWQPSGPPATRPAPLRGSSATRDRRWPRRRDPPPRRWNAGSTTRARSFQRLERSGRSPRPRPRLRQPTGPACACHPWSGTSGRCLGKTGAPGKPRSARRRLRGDTEPAPDTLSRS